MGNKTGSRYALTAGGTPALPVKVRAARSLRAGRPRSQWELRPGATTLKQVCPTMKRVKIAVINRGRIRHWNL
jgi:hypothetical protein